MVKSLSMRRTRSEELSLNLTPLIDVVFLLLIFFMITTSFKQNEQLGVELPESSGQQIKVVSQGLSLGISQQGTYKVHDQELGNNVKALELALQAWVKQNPGQPLLIMGDRLAPHQSVVTAMDIAQRSGISKIKIVTEYQQK